MIEHVGSRDMYEQIAQWVAPAGKDVKPHETFFFSKRDVWHRFGMLGVFGDFVLSACQEGGVLEIGTGESSIYLTEIAKKYRRTIVHCDIQASKILNPLTIPGCFGSQDWGGGQVTVGQDVYDLPSDVTYVASPEGLLNPVKRVLLYSGSSDELFEFFGPQMGTLALAFIDGDHLYEQAKKDFWNLVPFMVPNGYILLHDTHPPSEEYLSENRCGEVWRLRKDIESKPELFDVITLPAGCAIGVGLTIVRIKPADLPEYQR